MQGIYMSESDLPESNTFRCCFQSHLDSWCSSEHALHRDGNQFPGTTLWNLIHRQQYTSVTVYNILYLTCLACHHTNTVCIWSLRGDTHLVGTVKFVTWWLSSGPAPTAGWGTPEPVEDEEVFYSCKQSQQDMKVAANCVYQRYHCQWYCWWSIIYNISLFF